MCSSDLIDKNIVKICAIEQCGFEDIKELHDDVIKFLSSANEEVLVSTLKALRKIGNKKDIKKIVALKEHNSYLVRAEVMMAVGHIDLKNSKEILIEGLKDKEWHVRSVSANNLANLKQTKKLLNEIKEDEQAYEILHFAIERKKIVEGVKKYETNLTGPHSVL